MNGSFHRRRFLQMVALLLATALSVGCMAAPATVDIAGIADAEARWLWTQQLSNGAFAYFYAGDGEVAINPYFSSECAIALMRHDASGSCKKKARAYLDWYFRHLNTAQADPNGLAGTVFDYTATVEGGVVTKEVSSGTYDSTDSYAALFLLALYAYLDAYGDAAYLETQEQNIRQVIDAMLATMDGGYTFANPDYREYYLMDNCEVYAGLNGAAALSDAVFHDTALSAKLRQCAAFYETNFTADWASGDHYADALYTDDFSWGKFYQCAVSQAFPVLFGLLSPQSEEAAALYRRFCDEVRWEDLEYRTSGQSDYYWGHLALWGAMMGDTKRVDTYLRHYTAAVAAGREYPLVGADAALVLMACDYMQG